MSRSYRRIFENSVNEVENVLDSIKDSLTEAHRIMTTIRDRDVSTETVEKINEVEYIIGGLLNELE